MQRRGLIEGKGGIRRTEGIIGGLKFVAFEVSPDEISRAIPEAREIASRIAETILFSNGVPKERARMYAERIRRGEDLHKVLEEVSMSDDVLENLPSIEEIAAEITLGKLLATVPDAPKIVRVIEDKANNLPEYSLYWIPDPSGWAGKWYWSGIYPSVPEAVCDPNRFGWDVCNKVVSTILDLDERAKKRGNQLFFAIWR